MIFANPAFVENLEMSVNLAAICNVSKKISPMLSLFEQGNCQKWSVLMVFDTQNPEEI